MGRISTVKNALITSRGPNHVALNWGERMDCSDEAARAAWAAFPDRTRVDVAVDVGDGRSAPRVVSIGPTSA